MILEALEWTITPASLLARRSGLLAGQIAIRHRAQRCRALWHSHLTASRQAIQSHIQGLKRPLNRVMVMGSGHLHDCDLHTLLTQAKHVVLVDIVHPLELYWHRARSHGRLTLIDRDLSFSLSRALRGQTTVDEPDADFVAELQSCDLVISLNLLSQLPIGAHDLWTRQGQDESQIDHWAGLIVSNHVTLLQQARQALLITDSVVRLRGQEKGQPLIGAWQDLLYGVTLPEPDTDWLWTIASPQERGDDYWEERRVGARIIDPA
jgi:hypothetical protein